VASDASSDHYSRVHSVLTDGRSETVSVSADSPRARYYDQLRELALEVLIPLGLPQPMLADPTHKTVPQIASNKSGAEEYLMSRRPKKLFGGKSSKTFTSDEILLGLYDAVQTNMPHPVIEALLHLAEASGSTLAHMHAGPAFITNKKGPAIPTIDYTFSQTREMSLRRLFLSRVSQRARDTALATELEGPAPSGEFIRNLLEWGADPELCGAQILNKITSQTDGSEDLIETLLLSPSLGSPEFLNQALSLASSCQSLRNSAMLLLRGANGNYNHGEALKAAMFKHSYDIALAIMLLSKQPISSSILDDTVSTIALWKPELQKPYLKVLLLAGSCGPRTSRALIPYLKARDEEIISMLVESQAFRHSTFPAPLLFQIGVEANNTTLALNVLRCSRNHSFSDYAKTGVHLKLVQGFIACPGDCLEIISQLLTLGLAGDFASQMLLKCCDESLIHSTGIMTLINLLVDNGSAKAEHAEGKCMLLAIEAGDPTIVKTLLSTKPSGKTLSTAVEHVDLVLEDTNPAKLKIWSELLRAGAFGPSVDKQLVSAIDRTVHALTKVQTLLLGASVEYEDGEAITKAIRLERLDILELCLSKNVTRSVLLAIWKQTRRLFAIAGAVPYSVRYMLDVFHHLYKAKEDAAPLGDFLHDATQCQSADTAFALCSQFIVWGASSDHALGAPLVACIKRCDIRTLALLLSKTQTKKALKYAIEAAISLRGKDRLEILRLLIGASPEQSCLNAALPEVLKEKNYDPLVVELLVGSGTRILNSWDDYLTPPVLNLDLSTVQRLVPTGGEKDCCWKPLEALLKTRSDWKTPSGESLPMVKFLLSKASPGTWADAIFATQVKVANQHAATLLVGHVSSVQVLSDTLSELLSQETLQWSQEQLSMMDYMLSRGAKGDVVDQTFLRATKELQYDWMKVLGPFLTTASTKLTAFEMIDKDLRNDPALQGSRLEMRQFLVKQGVQGQVIDEAFIVYAGEGDLSGIRELLPAVTSKESYSQALSAISKKPEFFSNRDGLEIVRLLIEHGASESSVIGITRVAAKVHSQPTLDLVLGMCKNDATRKAAFQGLLDCKDPLSTTESRSVLRYLIDHGLSSEDRKSVAHIAAITYDVALLGDLISTTNSNGLLNLALTVAATTGEQWLSVSGLTFVKFLLDKGARDPVLLTMIEMASRAQHLTALRLVLAACGDKTHATSIAFTALSFEDAVSPSIESISVLRFLLEEGATGAAVEKAATHAAETSNYEALDIFLNSPAAAMIIPVALKAVARNKSQHLSSKQLSVASILVKHGVSTDILAIAATEAARLLDIEALKVLSQSPRFPGVTDDTLRTLLLSDKLWRSSEGFRIVQFLFQIGVSANSAEAIVTKATTALDIDAIRVVLDSTQHEGLVDVAFTSMTGLCPEWLCPEGLRVAESLLQMEPSQPIVDKAFIQACRYLHHPAAELLLPFITDPSIVQIALAKATNSDSDWYSELHLIERLIDISDEGEVVDSALIKAAQALQYNAVELLASKVSRPEVYTKALTAATTNENWHQSLPVIQFLLDHSAYGESVESAYVAAASSLDWDATELFARYVNSADADSRAFSAATSHELWLLPQYLEFVKFLYDRGVSLDAVECALNSATEAFSVPAVTLLAENIDEKIATMAFKTTTGDGKSWDTPDGISILEILVQKGARGGSVDKSLVKSAELLQLYLVQLIHPNVDDGNVQCFSDAFAAVTTNEQWLSHPDALEILQILIKRGVAADSASGAFIHSAQEGNLDALILLTNVVQDRSAIVEAFGAFIQAGQRWLQDDSHALLDHLLSYEVPSDSVSFALSKATQGVILGESYLELLTLLLDHGADNDYHDGEALQLAIQHGRVDIVDILLQYPTNAVTLYMAFQTSLRSGHGEEEVLELFQAFSNSYEGVTPDTNHDSDLGIPLIFYCLQNYPSSVTLAYQICELGADLTKTIIWSVYPNVSDDSITPLQFAILNQVFDEVVDEVLLVRDRK
jgi:hypothetical protein